MIQALTGALVNNVSFKISFMNEVLLQYLWQNKLIQPVGLKTLNGEPVVIVHQGRHNTNAGPDFLEAKIKIGNTLWVGNVELHVKSSDWFKHYHQHDEAYKNIILHVVYESDKVHTSPSFPEMEVKDNIPLDLVERYSQLMGNQNPIACASQNLSYDDLKWSMFLESLLIERWEQRLHEWRTILSHKNNDWRSLLYYRLAANFGFHINRDAFLQLAQSLPLNIIAKHRTNLVQVEALLFGNAGLLHNKPTDDYEASLEQEYHYLRRKYQLEPIKAHLWKFMRLRPQNFPTIRIAQFAALLHQSESLFSKMMEISDAESLMQILKVSASTYWDNHFRFGEQTEKSTPKKLGADAITNILINTVAPMQFLYAKEQGKHELSDKSIHLLQAIKPENNNIIRLWEKLGRKATDAAQTQAMLQLYNEYCSSKKCLQCSVGNYLLRHKQ